MGQLNRKKINARRRAKEEKTEPFLKSVSSLKPPAGSVSRQTLQRLFNEQFREFEPVVSQLKSSAKVITMVHTSKTEGLGKEPELFGRQPSLLSLNNGAFDRSKLKKDDLSW